MSTQAIRQAIRDLDRDGTARLSKKTDIRRSDLIDYADIGLPLPDAEMARLEIWFSQHTLRRGIERATPQMVEGMAVAMGISDERRDLFISDVVDLTPDEMAKASDYISGRHGMPKAEILPAMVTQSGPSLAEVMERGGLINELQRLPIDTLRSLVASVTQRAA